MYVTRRLLRSTLPVEPPKTPEAKPEAAERALALCLPPRRAAVRASAKICAVIAEAAGNRVVKPATENGGDGRNKRSHKKKKPVETQAAVESAAKDADSSVPMRGLELLVDVRYKQGAYAEARILALDQATRRAFVHYMGWNARYDAWVTPEDVAAHGSHTNAATKGAGWDGKTSLFASVADGDASQLNAHAPSEQEKKKRSLLSPRERQAARRALRNASPRPNSSKERKRSSEAVAEQRPPPKRTDRKSPKCSTAEATKLKVAPSRSNAVVKPETPVRRSTRRVQVAVGTTDEASERNETADLVLDVEIQGRHPSESSSDEAVDEEEEEEDEDAPPSRSSKRKKSQARKKASATVRQAESTETVAEAKRKRDIDSKSHKAKKHKKVAAKSTGSKATRSAAVSKGGPPPRSGHGGLNSATREKLAAIFRLRVQQKQQMEMMNAGQLSFQQSLQDEVMQATSASSTPDYSGASASSAAVNSTAATDEYHRQLQQYYYHQQVLLASNLSMSASSSEDPSTMALQGGIIDPRVIQERLTALEERRRQQAHVQAYYRQLMLTRERNVRALAANQTFVSTSAAAWQQQMKELQKEDGTASVKSWKDVTDTLSASDKEAGGGENDSPSTESGEAVEPESGGEGDKSSTSSVEKMETSPAAVATGGGEMTSPDRVEKAAKGDQMAGKDEGKSDPTAGKTATEGESVLYEFVL